MPNRWSKVRADSTVSHTSDYSVDEDDSDTVDDVIETAEYEMLSPDQLMMHMSELVADASLLIDLPPTYQRLLLDHFNWDKSAMVEYYYDRGLAKCLWRANLDKSYKFVSHSFNLPSTGTFSCDICCVTYPAANVYALGCQHIFCKDCWSQYVKSKVEDGIAGDRISCPQFKCPAILEDNVTFKFIEEPSVLLRCKKLLLHGFVQHNRSLTWCPGADCGFAARASSFVGGRQVTCTNCSQVFCFTCGQSSHEPIQCAQLKTWQKKATDDSGTADYVLKMTKDCPKCMATIEKDGGCNHMTCRAVGCQHEFCWICMKPWSKHGSACNQFQELPKSNQRSEIERYQFYYERYSNHNTSLQFESKLFLDVEGKLEVLGEQGLTWLEMDFVKTVLKTLCRCRCTLTYTYPFAYLLKRNNAAELFESNQGDLEKATEDLSDFLEHKLNLNEVQSMKTYMQDKARYCELRRQILLRHVQEGYDNEKWDFITV